MMELIEHERATGAQGSVDDTLTLAFDLRQKSRQRVRLDSGLEAAILLPRGTTLEEGDLLRAVDGTSVGVHAAAQSVSTAASSDHERLARACYHLGNRHVALQLGAGWVRYQPDHVLDEMVAGLGLQVTRESAPFEPERGAYHSHSSHSHPRVEPSTSASDSDAGRNRDATPSSANGAGT